MLHGPALPAILVLIAAAYAYLWHSPAPPLPPLSATARRVVARAGGKERTYHVIPQQAYRFPRLLGKTTSLLDAPREASRFFEGVRLV
jgi:hypothetical protein